MAANLAGATVAFDLDGTLVHTAPDLVRALNYVLASDGLSPVPLERVHGMIGLGAMHLILEGYRFNGRALAAERRQDARAAFIAHYQGNICVDSAPYPGARPMLERLQALGAKLCVCTNKPQALADRLLSALELDQWFGSVIGADTPPAPKPDASHPQMAVERAGGSMDRALLVGDSQTDERAARASGLPFLFVPFGYGPAPQQPCRQAETLERVPDLALELLA